MPERDGLHRDLIRLGNKPFRRIRKHVGETWKPDQRKQPNTDLGVWCKACQSVHPWRNRRTLGFRLEKRQTNWWILWYCTRTNNVLKEEGVKKDGKR